MFGSTVSFLNDRELAIGIWLAIGLAWAMTRGEIRASMGHVVKALFAPKLLGTIIGAAIYSTLVVLTLRQASFWHGSMLRDTIFWFVGTAFISLMNTPGKGVDFFRGVIDDGFRIVVIVEFVANLYVFPLYVELVLIPIVFFAVATHAYAETDPQYASARKLLGFLLTIFGLATLAFSIEHIAGDFHHVVTRETLLAFLLPLVLTIAFVPFLYAFALITAYELIFTRVGVALRDNEPLRRGTKRAILRACGANLGRVNRFATEFCPRLFGASSAAGVGRILDQFEASVRRRRAARIA